MTLLAQLYETHAALRDNGYPNLAVALYHDPVILLGAGMSLMVLVAFIMITYRDPNSGWRGFISWPGASFLAIAFALLMGAHDSANDNLRHYESSALGTEDLNATLTALEAMECPEAQPKLADIKQGMSQGRDPTHLDALILLAAADQCAERSRAAETRAAIERL